MKKSDWLFGVVGLFLAVGAASAAMQDGVPVTIANTTVAYALTPPAVRASRCNLEAPATNTGVIYYGATSAVNATTGRVLNPGDARTIVDSDKASRIYVRGSAVNDTVVYDWTD